MTAPDPGLTDLIAAHYPTYDARQVFDGCACGKSMFRKDHPAHVALVVEQHTNGRVAELEARIARVENALPDIKDTEADDMHDIGWDRGQQVLAGYIRSATKGDDSPAALEGEQQ